MKVDLSIFQAVSIIISILAFFVAYLMYKWVKKQPCPNERVNYIGGLIKEGANIFLKREYQ